jgi:hypothetical protein
MPAAFAPGQENVFHEIWVDDARCAVAAQVINPPI